MSPKLRGEVTLLFIMGGVNKEGKPYLKVSNGRAEMWVRLPKALGVDGDTFEKYSEDGLITLDVEMTVGSEAFKVLRIVE